MKKADHDGRPKIPTTDALPGSKQAIERGELAPGSRLPASRVYAQELGVSRATVENAWGELVAQGWLERRGQAGTFVSERLIPQQNAPVQPVAGDEPAAPLPFQLGLPALDLFPRGLWARVMGRRLRTQTRFDLARAILRRTDASPGDRRLFAPVAQH